jgi:hypothetical protein
MLEFFQQPKCKSFPLLFILIQNVLFRVFIAPVYKILMILCKGKYPCSYAQARHMVRGQWMFVEWMNNDEY